MRRVYYLVNSITLFRLGAALVLAVLLIYRRLDLFRWLLPLSLLSDLLDGWLARRFEAVSQRGARLDSLADLFTLAAGMAGLFVFRPDFLRQNLVPIAAVLTLYGLQMVLALFRYGRISAFHTYLAKITWTLGGLFLALIYLTPQPLYALFYLTISLAFLELTEEIALVLVLPRWQANVKGLYWVLHPKKQAGSPVASRFPARPHPRPEAKPPGG